MVTSSSLVFKTSLLVCLSQLITACDGDLHSAHEAQSKMTATQASPAAASKKSQISHQWKMSKDTDEKMFSAIFSCEKKPRIGEFQVCHLNLKSGNESVSDAKISIDGGMESHGHGLPTKPQVSATEVPGHYKIEGFKLTMPGEWIVGFKVLSKEQSDQVVFTFTI